jgi:hypothetical protein
MKKILRISGIAALLLGGMVAFAQTNDPPASSQINGSAMSRVVFPVNELGNCGSREACKLYCDDASHREACFSYAQKVGLMSKEKIDAAKQILSKKGPGGCSSQDSCKTYCADSSHSEECLAFAEEHKIIGPEKADLIKRIVKGEAPGACKSAQTCRMYCEDPSHRDECKAFAEENGLGRPNKVLEMTGSSTNPMREDMMPPRAGSSTMKNGEKPPALQTQEQKPPSQKLPPKPKEDGTGANLGAAVLNAFAHLLGF